MNVREAAQVGHIVPQVFLRSGKAMKYSKYQLVSGTVF